MSRTNFFAALESDDEDSAPITRGGQTAANKRGGQNAAYVEETRTLPWGDIMTGMRYQPNMTVKTTVANLTELHKDFCDEPWKYGDEIVEHWDSIAANPEMEQYWRDRDTFAIKPVPNFAPIASACAKACAKRWVERDIKNHVARITNAVITIQKVVRGYQARCNNPHLDCCMCLSHVFSPLRTDAGYMCRGCAEMGPHVDIFPNDPLNWSRTETLPEIDCHCSWCGKDVQREGDFCSDSCYIADREDRRW